jgi:uridine kinase
MKATLTEGSGPSRQTIFRDRSLPRRNSVRVSIHGFAHDQPVGLAARQVLPDRMHGKLVVAALVDQKAVSLTTPITSECHLGALTTAHWEGQRVHRHSVALLAVEAARRLQPPVALEMGPSIGFAQRISVSDPAGRPLADLAAELERAMYALVAERAPLLEEWWTVDEAREYFRKQESRAAELLDTWRDPAVALVSYGTAYALQMGPLLPDTGMLGGFHVASGEDVLLLAYGSEASALPLASSMFPAAPSPAEPNRRPSGSAAAEESEVAYVERHARRASVHVANVMLGQERWLEALGVTSVGALNHACVNGEISQLIRVSEGFHEKRIGAIADEIRDRRADVRVVCIAGPSSSGKTTFIQRLEVQLQVNGIKPIGLSLDDYYLDRERTPRDAAGQYDYEALEALDVDLLREQLKRLLDGQAVKTARFDFSTGNSDPRGGKDIQLTSGQVLLLEGIHGLNPHLLATIPAERVFRVFCCPLAQLPFDCLTRVHASDVRLLRRIVRDRHSRGTNAADSIVRWPSVRAGERRNIFPFQHHADAVFDSALTYELNVLRVYAERYLLEVPQDHVAYTTAFRLIRFLDRFVTIYPDHVPPTSILREFIGGSGFRY